MFCYNIPYGCQGVAMQLSRCSECCCFFVLLQYVFVRMFWLVVKVLLCSYQGVLSVVVFLCCYSMFCYNILSGYQGVAMQLSRCSECCCFFVLLQYVFVRMFWLVVKVLLCSYQGVLSVVVFLRCYSMFLL